MHYISGRNDTLLHRLMDNDLQNITFRDDPQESSLHVIIQLVLFFYVLIGLTHLINEYMMRNQTQ